MKLTKSSKNHHKYLDDLISLFSILKQQGTSVQFNDKINPYLSILQFQLNSQIVDSIDIHNTTGMPSFNDFSKIFAQRSIIEQKKQGVLTLEEIRDNLISDIDSQQNEFNINSHINSIANSLNIKQLERLSSSLNVESSAEKLETGHSTDLYKIKIDGYSQTNKTFLDYQIDIYLTKKKSKKFQQLQKSETSKLFTNLFGLRSDEIFHMLNSDEQIESVRSITRNIIGPYITQNTIPCESTNSYNPNLQNIIENLTQSPNVKALLHHTDVSSPNFFDQSDNALPTIEITHKYITNNQESKDYLCNFVSGDQVI